MAFPSPFTLWIRIVSYLGANCKQHFSIFDELEVLWLTSVVAQVVDRDT